jgi:hypothetical protein
MKPARYRDKDGTVYLYTSPGIVTYETGEYLGPSGSERIIRQIINARARRSRRARADAYESVGMVRGTDSLGRRIWE